jgi:hypothetical protein
MISDVSTIIFGKDENEIYVGGTTNQLGSYTNPVIAHMSSTSAGTFDWILSTSGYSFYSNAWDNHEITRLYYLSSSPAVLVGFG